MIGDPLPLVFSLELLTLIIPSPLSVASVAHEPPRVVIVTLSASILPPYVASNPRAELLPLVSIILSLIYIFEFSPVEKIALLPLPEVVILAFFIVAIELF